MHLNFKWFFFSWEIILMWKFYNHLEATEVITNFHTHTHTNTQRKILNIASRVLKVRCFFFENCRMCPTPTTQWLLWPEQHINSRLLTQDLTIPAQTCRTSVISQLWSCKEKTPTDPVGVDLTASVTSRRQRRRPTTKPPWCDAVRVRVPACTLPRRHFFFETLADWRVGSGTNSSSFARLSALIKTSISHRREEAIKQRTALTRVYKHVAVRMMSAARPPVCRFNLARRSRHQKLSDAPNGCEV